MKTINNWLLLVVLLFTLDAGHTFLYAESGRGSSGAPDGQQGVMEDSCWESSNGDTTIQFTDIHGTTMGGMYTEVTDQNGNVGHITNGTEDPDGGVSDTPGIDVDGDFTSDYRVKDGDAQKKNDADEWVDMHEVDWEDDDGDGDDKDPADDSDDTGSSPPPPPPIG